MQAAYSISMKIDRPIRELRRAKLNRLLESAGGAKALSARAEKGLTDTHLIACAKGRRDIGDDLATKLEVAAGKPFGWMDMPEVLVSVSKSWPFESLAESRFSSLTEREKGEAEAALRKAIEEIEDRRKANDARAA